MSGGSNGFDMALTTHEQLPALRAGLRQLALMSPVRAEDVVLAASELATNALLYTPGPTRVQGWNPPLRGPFRLEVRDLSPVGLPAVLAAVPSSTSGRGLLIVDHLASRWGVHLHDGLGKTVWFELDPQI